jgi:hypothetical protein
MASDLATTTVDPCKNSKNGGGGTGEQAQIQGGWARVSFFFLFFNSLTATGEKHPTMVNPFFS